MDLSFEQLTTDQNCDSILTSISKSTPKLTVKKRKQTSHLHTEIKQTEINKNRKLRYYRRIHKIRDKLLNPINTFWIEEKNSDNVDPEKQIKPNPSPKKKIIEENKYKSLRLSTDENRWKSR